jgi:hypothetical protein
VKQSRRSPNAVGVNRDRQPRNSPRAVLFVKGNDMATVKKAKIVLKTCPFAKTQCGDWCQLFMGGLCTFQMVEMGLSDILDELEKQKG